jgi:hypothetical protein
MAVINELYADVYMAVDHTGVRSSDTTCRGAGNTLAGLTSPFAYL